MAEASKMYWLVRDGIAKCYKKVACYAYPSDKLVFRNGDCYIREPKHDYVEENNDR